MAQRAPRPVTEGGRLHAIATTAEDHAWGVQVTAVGVSLPPDTAVTAGWRLLFLVRGSGVLLVKTPQGVAAQPAEAGDVVLLGPSPVSRFRSARQQPYLAHHIDLAGDLLDRWLEAGGLTTTPLVVQAGFDEPLLGLVAQMRDLAHQAPTGYRRLLAGCAANVVARLEVLHRLGQGIGRRRRLVGEARQRLADPTGDWQDLSHLAQEMGVTPTWLRRNFAAQTGSSLHQYRIDQRLARAQRRLLASDEPIARIAQDLGFSSAAYFARQFRQRTGLSPSLWRTHQDRVG